MAFPSKTTSDGIVATAIDLIARDGMEALTVAKLAQSLDIKAPSLYKRFSGIDEIIQNVERAVFIKLQSVLAKAVKGDTPAALLSACHAHRQFAKNNTNLYPLLFTQSRLAESEAADLRYKAAVPILKLFSDTPPGTALMKTRTLTAFVHGHVSIEIADGFQMGDNVDDAFEFGVNLLIENLLRG